MLGFKIAEIERRRALIELSKHYRVNVYSNSDVSDLLRIQYCRSVWTDEDAEGSGMSKINLNFYDTGTSRAAFRCASGCT